MSDVVTNAGDHADRSVANNQELISYLRATHDVCDQHNDVATA
jgi:hypothetical protein